MLYVYVMRRNEHFVGRMAIGMNVQENNGKGSHKGMWLDGVMDAIREKGLPKDKVYERATWALRMRGNMTKRKKKTDY